MRYDYSIFKKLPLKDPPVAIKYEFFAPEGIKPLDKGVECSFCELMRRCQTGNEAFCFSGENTETCVGKGLLGMEPPGPGAHSGFMGPQLGVFDSPRANLCTGRLITPMPPGSVNYVVFSPLDKVTFDPDVVVFSADPPTAEMVLRAYSYSTGEAYSSTCTAIAGCAWVMIYPYLTGKINFVVPALVHGMHGRELYSPSDILIGVPFTCLPTMIDNLGEMQLHLSGHKNKAAYYEELGSIQTDLASRAEGEYKRHTWGNDQ